MDAEQTKLGRTDISYRPAEQTIATSYTNVYIQNNSAEQTNLFNGHRTDKIRQDRHSHCPAEQTISTTFLNDENYAFDRHAFSDHLS